MKKIIQILLFISGILFGNVQANDDQTKDEKKAKLEKLLLLSLEELLEVKVGVASRQEELLKDAPSSVMVFTYEELRNMGIRTVEELLNYVPGMQTSKAINGGSTVVISRGFLSIEGATILFLINGQRMNDHYLANVFGSNPLINIENIERLEIIRGPGSALYGSNAFLGVINIITNRTRNKISAEIGTNNSYRASVSANDKINGFKLSGFASVYGDKGQHYNNVFDRYYQTSETQDPKRGLDVSFEADYQDISLGLHHFQRHFKDFYQYDSLGNGIAKENVSQTMLNLKWKTNITPRLQTQVGLSGSYLQLDALTLAAPAGMMPPFMAADYLSGSITQYGLMTLNNDWTYTIANKHKLNFGLQYEFANMPKSYMRSNYDVLNFSYLGRVVDQIEDSKRLIEDKTRRIQSVYVEDNYHWNDDIHSIVGARYDHYNDFGNALTPRLALIYTTPWKDNLKLMYGQAYRAPPLGYLWFKDNPLIVGNPNLQAENIKTTEIAYTHIAPQRQITLTYFHNKIKDMYQYALVDPVWNTTQPQNVGGGHSEGIELEISQQIDKHWLFKANVSKMLSNSLQTGYAPNYSGSAILNYSHNDWTFNINGYLRGPVSILPNQGRIVIFNALARYQFSKPLSLELTANNLFDKTYYDAQSGSGLGMDLNGNIVRELPRRGREMFLGINYRF